MGGKRGVKWIDDHSDKGVRSRVVEEWREAWTASVGKLNAATIDRRDQLSNREVTSDLSGVRSL